MSKYDGFDYSRFDGPQVVYRSLQHLFDDMYKHVVSQGRKCVNSYGCSYRSQGMACAVGGILSNDTVDRFDLMSINPELSFAGVFETLEDVTAWWAAWSRSSATTQAAVCIRLAVCPSLGLAGGRLMSDMQKCHDNLGGGQDFVERFKEAAARVASDFGLTVPEDS